MVKLYWGEHGVWHLKLLSYLWYCCLLCFLIVKWRVGYYLNNQKSRFLENGGNLELEINLNAASTSAGSGGVRRVRQSRCGRYTLKFYNSIKLSQHVYKKQYYPETLSICTNGWAHTFSLLHAKMMCLVKLFSVYIHVHFMFETLVSAPVPVAFHFLDVSVWTPVLPFV